MIYGQDALMTLMQWKEKIGILRMTIHQAITNLYKSYVAKYLSDVGGNNISYTDRALMASGKAAQKTKGKIIT